MSIIHLVDTDALRKRGLHREADVLDSIQPSPPLPPSTPAAIAPDSHDSSSRSAASSSGPAGASSSSNEAGSGAAGAAANSSGSTLQGGGGASSGRGKAVSGGSASEASEAHGQAPTEQPGQHLAQQSHDIHADPLGGLHSERLRENLARDAFRNASSTAQDTAIASAADRLLPPEMRALAAGPTPELDISPAARTARIEALKGEIPAWAQGDPSNDPKILRIMEKAAAERAAGPTPAQASRPASARESDLAAAKVVLREPAQMAGRSPVQALARALGPAPKRTAGPAPAQASRPASSAAAHPAAAKAPRAADSGREI